MKKLFLTLLCFLMIITGVFASSSSPKEVIKMKTKSCFNLLSKKRNEIPLKDIEITENYLKKKLNEDLLTRHIIQETYIEEINRLSTEYNEVELQNLRISGIRLGLEQFQPIKLFDIETDSNKSKAFFYEDGNNCECNIF